MIFGLYKQSYNQTLNIKTIFENCIICDVRIRRRSAANNWQILASCLYFVE